MTYENDSEEILSQGFNRLSAEVIETSAGPPTPFLAIPPLSLRLRHNLVAFLIIG
jgi:hypothetical protein